MLTGLDEIADGIRTYFDLLYEAREAAFSASRQVIRSASITIKHVHREEMEHAREQLHALIERTIIARAVAEGMSQRTLAAKLGLSRTTLRKRMEEYGLE